MRSPHQQRLFGIRTPEPGIRDIGSLYRELSGSLEQIVRQKLAMRAQGVFIDAVVCYSSLLRKDSESHNDYQDEDDGPPADGAVPNWNTCS